MSSGLTETLSIENNKALINEWEGQLLRLSMQKRLLQKHSSNDITEIHARYAPQKEEIRNKIADLGDDSSSTEYQQLMTELHDLEVKENNEIDYIERQMTEQENDVQAEIDSLESRKEAAEKDTESMEEMRSQNIEKSFGYFKT